RRHRHSFHLPPVAEFRPPPDRWRVGGSVHDEGEAGAGRLVGRSAVRCHDIVWLSCYAGPVKRNVAMPSTETRNEKLDLRLTPSAKRALQAAAIAARRSVSEFVLESALARAEETLPDRRRFGLS